MSDPVDAFDSFDEDNLDTYRFPPPVPEGYYKLRLGNYQERRVGEDQKLLAEYEVRILEGLSGQDLSGVNLDRVKPKFTLWFTQSAAPISGRIIRTINPAAPGNRADALQSIIGADAIGFIKLQQNKKRPEFTDAIVYNVVSEEELAAKLAQQ